MREVPKVEDMAPDGRDGGEQPPPVQYRVLYKEAAVAEASPNHPLAFDSRVSCGIKVGVRASSRLRF